MATAIIAEHAIFSLSDVAHVNMNAIFARPIAAFAMPACMTSSRTPLALRDATGAMSENAYGYRMVAGRFLKSR